MSNPVTPSRTSEDSAETVDTSRWSGRFRRFEAQASKKPLPQSIPSDSLLSTPFGTGEAPEDYEPDDEDQQPSRRRKRTYAEMSAESDFHENCSIGISIPRRHAIAQECINVLKIKFALTPEDEAEMKSLSEVDELRRDLMLYGQLLGVHQLIRKSEALKPAYTISSEMNTNIQAYVWQVGLSPYLQKYKCTWTNLVVAVMREARVDNLPPASNAGQMSIVSACIGAHATKIRYYLKEVLELSFGMAKKKKNAESQKFHITTIARTLAAKCSVSGKRSIAITVEMLQRLALLRVIYVRYQEDNINGDFWSYVDKQLRSYASERPNATDYKAWLNMILQFDMEMYPRTDGYSGFHDAIVSHDKLPDSQKIVDKQARIMKISDM